MVTLFGRYRAADEGGRGHGRQRHQSSLVVGKRLHRLGKTPSENANSRSLADYSDREILRLPWALDLNSARALIGTTT